MLLFKDRLQSKLVSTIRLIRLAVSLYQRYRCIQYLYVKYTQIQNQCWYALTQCNRRNIRAVRCVVRFLLFYLHVLMIYMRVAQITCFTHVIYETNIYRHWSNSKGNQIILFPLFIAYTQQLALPSIVHSSFSFNPIPVI